jgi:hypothetical protein
MSLAHVAGAVGMLHPSLRYTRAFTPQPAQLRIPLTSPAMPHTEKLLKSCKLRLLLPRLRHIAARKGSAIFGNVIAIFFPNSAIQFPQFSACVYRLHSGLFVQMAESTRRSHQQQEMQEIVACFTLQFLGLRLLPSAAGGGGGGGDSRSAPRAAFVRWRRGSRKSGETTLYSLVPVDFHTCVYIF